MDKEKVLNLKIKKWKFVIFFCKWGEKKKNYKQKIELKIFYWNVIVLGIRFEAFHPVYRDYLRVGFSFYIFLSMNIICTSWSKAKISTMDSPSIYYHLYGRFTGPFGKGTSWEYLQFLSRVPWEWEIPELQTIDVGLWRGFHSNIPICWTLASAILTQCDSDWSFWAATW